MTYPSSPYPRRTFLRDLGAASLGSALWAVPSTSAASTSPSPVKVRTSRLPQTLPDQPTRVFVQEEKAELLPTSRNGNRFSTAATSVSINEGQIRVACPKGFLSRVVVRWELSFPSDCLFLGDHWERGYGDLQWRHLQPERILPWYMAAHDTASQQTFALGVATQPAAFCFWTVDAEGVSLWLDFRNGGSPCLPGDRELLAATVTSTFSRDAESPFATLRRFCGLLCRAPRLPTAPVCGNNNWYYAYGRDFDADAMRRDGAFLAELAGDHRNHPFCVIDAGWTPGSVCPGGPWTAGDPKRFPDMPGLASDLRHLGVRPGIWVRPTALTVVDDPKRLRPGPANGEEKPLDLTLPDNVRTVRDDLARLRSWGFDLIKHDFSTYDLLGKWGFEMGAELTDEGWHFADRSLTNAEIILRLYRTLREGAGDALLLGCNTVGHLGAGLFEIQRTGDDTSGRVWERTRRMGVNTLAYRIPQHGTFFCADPDCAAHTQQTPWELDRQFLDLVARSGNALFVSINPREATPEQKQVLSAAVKRALSGGDAGGCEPLDWITSTAPKSWKFGESTASYTWEQGFGAWPLKV